MSERSLAQPTFDSVIDLPDGAFGQNPMVAMSSDGQVRAYTFKANDVDRQRVVFSTDGGSTYNDHDVTSGDTTSEAGVLGMSDDGQTMAVVYRRFPGAYVSLSTDGGSTWSAEQTLNDGANGRAWAPQVAVSGDGQTIVYAWYTKINDEKDTAQFIYSTDGGQTWSNTITPSTPGVADEQDVNVVVSDDGQTIALAWKSDNTTTQGYYSFDGGSNWTMKDISAEGDGTTGSSMPHLGVSGDGSTLAYVWVAGTSVQTAVTSDAGSSWTNKVLSSGRSQYAYPRVVLDKDGSHRLYGWADRPESDWITRQSYTSDGGSNWTEDVALSVGFSNGGPKLAMSDDGTVMTSTWRERDTNSEFNIHATTTIDGGSEWDSRQISDSATTSNATYPHPAVSGDGTAMAYTWQFGGWPNIKIQTLSSVTNVILPPDAPVLDSATAGNSSADLAWTAPTSDGGAAITDYEYRLDGSGDWTSLSTTGTSATVTGLVNGTTYAIEIRAVNEAGNGAASNSVNVTPIGPALNPNFGTPSSAADGFTVQVSNHDGAYTWAVTTTAGSATISDSGLVTVTGLAPGQSATVTVNTTRTGYNSGSAQVSGSAATGSGLTPTFGTPSSTADGFTVQVSNYSASYTWTVTTTAGSATISDSGLVTVTGLTSGQSATVTVTATRTGYDNGSAQVSGSAVIADSDGDGVNDDNDPFPNAVTEKTAAGVTLRTTPPSAESSCSLDSLSIDTVATESAGVAVNGSGVGISFSLSGCDTGSLETLTISIDLGTAPAAGSVAMKIDSEGNWGQIEGATIEGSIVTYTITDNGPLDQDPDPGTMADPMTVAIPYSEPALPVPTLPALLLGLMSLLMGLLGYRRLAH